MLSVLVTHVSTYDPAYFLQPLLWGRDAAPKVVQSIMGHQHYSTTIDIYTHVSESKYQEEAGKIGRAMEPEEMGNENNKKTDLDNWHWQEKLKLEEHHHLLTII